MMRFIGGFLAASVGAVAYDYLGSVRVFLLNSFVPVAIAITSVWIPDLSTRKLSNGEKRGRNYGRQ